jgi:hypothetical protein
LNDLNPGNKTTKKHFFNLFLMVFGFIQIVLSPLLAGTAIGFALYVSKPDNLRLFIAISIASVGLTVGIIWAVKISRKKRIFDYTTTAKSPDFDKI